MGNVMMMYGTSLTCHHDICASLHGTSRRLLVHIEGKTFTKTPQYKLSQKLNQKM